MTTPDNDRPEVPHSVTDPFWKGGVLYPPGMYPVKDFVKRHQERLKLHLKTHKQGDVLYYVNGRFWIRCYTHRRLEPATWLV